MVLGMTAPIDIEEFGPDEDKNDRNGGEGGRMFEGEAIKFVIFFLKFIDCRT